MTLPKRRDILLQRKSALASFVNGRTLVVGQHIDACAPSLNLARDLGKLLLILFRPGFYMTKHFFCAWAHEQILAQELIVLHIEPNRVGSALVEHASFGGWTRKQQYQPYRLFRQLIANLLRTPDDLIHLVDGGASKMRHRRRDR
jgi:hypothetical protein